MKYIIGQDRTQIHLFDSSLEQAIDQDNEVRLIDRFVDSLNPVSLSADACLMFTAMNFCRIMNIVGFDTLKVYLREIIALLNSFLCLLALSKPYGYPNHLTRFFRTSIWLIIIFLNFKLRFGLKPICEPGF
jgi:hypothetical protein